MQTIKGPGLFLGQFAGDDAPFNTLPGIAKWSADCGFTGVQLPTWDTRFVDIEKAAESDTYCDELKGQAKEAGVEICDSASHIQGQLCAVHPAYDSWMDGLCPKEVRGDRKARQEWAIQQLKYCASASRRLGIDRHATFSGGLAWPFFYPFPQRDGSLIEEAYDELARIWKPILDHYEQRRRVPVLRDSPDGRPVRRYDLRDVPRACRQSSTLHDQLRCQPLRQARARLSRVHRHLSRTHQDVSRQGLGIQPDRPSGISLGNATLAQACCTRSFSR